MSPKDRKSSVFADRSAPKGKVEKKAVRPMAELQSRLAKESRGKSGRKLTLRDRLAETLPLFGVINIAEVGLGVIIVGSVLMIWVFPHLRIWGFVSVGVGFVIMRYGDRWLRGEL